MAGNFCTNVPLFWLRPFQKLFRRVGQVFNLNRLPLRPLLPRIPEKLHNGVGLYAKIDWKMFRKISRKWSQPLLPSSDQLRNNWQRAPLSKGPGSHRDHGANEGTDTGGNLLKHSHPEVRELAKKLSKAPQTIGVKA